MRTLPIRIDWDPVENRRRVAIPAGALRTSVPDLCRRAGIPVRATIDRDVYVYRGRKKVRTPTCDLVGVPTSPRSHEGALRALESLAYSFFDHCARYCVCGRGYFSAPSVNRSGKFKGERQPFKRESNAARSVNRATTNKERLT